MSDPKHVSAWDERPLYWPPPFDPKKSHKLVRDEAGLVFWIVENLATVDVFPAVRVDPKAAVALMRSADAEYRAAGALAERLDAEWKATRDAATEASRRAGDLSQAAHMTEWAVLLLIRSGELP